MLSGFRTGNGGALHPLPSSREEQQHFWYSNRNACLLIRVYDSEHCIVCRRNNTRRLEAVTFLCQPKKEPCSLLLTRTISIDCAQACITSHFTPTITPSTASLSGTSLNLNTHRLMKGGYIWGSGLQCDSGSLARVTLLFPPSLVVRLSWLPCCFNTASAIRNEMASYAGPDKNEY